jgi:hypothetical protein
MQDAGPERTVGNGETRAPWRSPMVRSVAAGWFGDHALARKRERMFAAPQSDVPNPPETPVRSPLGDGGRRFDSLKPNWPLQRR